jgi:Ser/Thr protein kinase RdoA (MazF antagonist)
MHNKFERGWLMLYNDIKQAIRQFNFEGKYHSAEELRSGNINSTYRLTFVKSDGTRQDYILQRINTVVFKDPYGVMENITNVIDHIDKKLSEAGEDTARRLLHFVSTKSGSYLYRDTAGSFWRAYVFVDGVTAYNSIEDPNLFYEAGRGFGEFQKNLFDFPAEVLHETIPDFHNTKRRFYTFVAAIAEDKAGRVHELEDEIDFLFDRRKMMSEIVDKIDSGILPMRVTHNDTKLNNVLIDNRTGKAACVIDLDTVMPGSSLYDYGDAIRFGASTAAEDEPDLSKITVNMELFRLFTKGFVEEIANALTKEEIHYLPLGAKVMTCELALRFLTDYINGDEYFKINSPDHNLIRARAQMKLLTEIEAKYDEMVEYVDSLIEE